MAVAKRTTAWFPVARSSEVGTTPVPVGADGRPYVVVRLRPGGEVSAFPAHCPHRLVPLAAATVVEGRLRCPYHGWQFDAEGRCVDIPSLGPDGTPPPRADLAVPWAVEERGGWVWIAPAPTSERCPPRGGAAPEPAPVPEPPPGPVFGNLDPSLEHAWHPVALSRELRPGGWLQVRLLGRTWMLRRTPDGLEVDPPAWGVRERLGLVWLAPAEPRDVPLEVPEARDRRFVAGWLTPVRSTCPAGPLADAFLDGAHVPFVHAGTSGAAERPAVPAVDVTARPGGFEGVQEQWLDDPQDPTGGRPLRRRATHVFRAPFQLRRRLDLLDTGAATAVLLLLQPEDADSTRVYSCLLLASPPGLPLPSPATVAAEVAREEEVLAEELRLQARAAGTGLPLAMRDELHVPADRLGVALRRALCDFRVAGRARAAA
ncbi:Rieske 2Fe-2S domain-containing protein [Geodermatophilus sp. SYSU D00815]